MKIELGCVSTLGIVFIILKLLNVINWSWLWVLSPFWICALIFTGFLVAILAIAVATNDDK